MVWNPGMLLRTLAGLLLLSGLPLLPLQCDRQASPVDSTLGVTLSNTPAGLVDSQTTLPTVTSSIALERLP